MLRNTGLSLKITFATSSHGEKYTMRSGGKALYKKYICYIISTLYVFKAHVARKKGTGIYSCINNNFLKVIFIFLFIYFLCFL